MKANINKIARQGISCQITAYHIDDSENSEDSYPEQGKWMAIATAHVFDEAKEIPNMSRSDVIRTGEMMRTITCRSFSDKESNAMIIALEGLLHMLSAEGFSKDKIKIWLWLAIMRGYDPAYLLKNSG
jgi:hypothetical protein